MRRGSDSFQWFRSSIRSWMSIWVVKIQYLLVSTDTHISHHFSPETDESRWNRNSYILFVCFYSLLVFDDGVCFVCFLSSYLYFLFSCILNYFLHEIINNCLQDLSFGAPFLGSRPYVSIRRLGLIKPKPRFKTLEKVLQYNAVLLKSELTHTNLILLLLEVLFIRNTTMLCSNSIVETI